MSTEHAPIKAKLFDPEDTVAVVLSSATPKMPIEIVQGETMVTMTAEQEIPIYHKVAVQPMRKGASVLRSGIVIGVARQEIAVGDWVHVHNVASLRGGGSP